MLSKIITRENRAASRLSRKRAIAPNKSPARLKSLASHGASPDALSADRLCGSKDRPPVCSPQSKEGQPMPTCTKKRLSQATAKLDRTTFSTSRAGELFTRRGFVAQTGHDLRSSGAMAAKEMLDNGLDACEAAGIPPQLSLSSAEGCLTVIDNGPGIPIATIERGLDCTHTVSDKASYIAPCRGAQGHALATIWALPYVLSGGREGRVELSTAGEGFEVITRFDKIKETPRLTLQRGAAICKKGTAFKIRWPDASPCLIEPSEADFLQVAFGYAVLNPHLSLTVHSVANGETHSYEATDTAWRKWQPSDPTPASWYSTEDLARLIAAYVGHGERDGRVKKCREFLEEFHGLKSTAKQKAITDELGLTGVDLSALVSDGEPDMDRIGRLLAAMKRETREIEPKKLGVIGEDHFRARFCGIGCDPGQFKYAIRHGKSEAGLPFVVEVAFAYSPRHHDRQLIAGANWSPCVGGLPFEDLRNGSTLDSFLNEQRCGHDQPVVLALHLTTPKIPWKGRGKNRTDLDDEMAAALVSAIDKCTKGWAISRKQAERHEDKEARTYQRMYRSEKLTFTAAAEQVIPEAYRLASTDFKYRGIPARQVWYQARPLLLKMGLAPELLNDVRFTQHFLPDFVKENPELTKDWDVVYDARGKLTEPHTGRAVPLGTLQVRSYIANTRDFSPGWLDAPTLPELRPSGCETHGPQHRFGALLFVEKEGFSELFKSVHLAERYDVAILSSKGLTSTAARQLVDDLTGYANDVLGHDLPLFVLHDFDKSGMSILGTFTRESRRYAYAHELKVIDLGLRLDDVKRMDLQSEPVEVSGKDPAQNLSDNGATADEIEFLLCGARHGKSVTGQRVELNVMDAGQFITWIEGKLTEHGVQKILPPADVLERAFRQFTAEKDLQRILEDARASVMRAAESAPIPPGLRQSVADMLRNEPRLSWDAALARKVTGGL